MFILRFLVVSRDFDRKYEKRRPFYFRGTAGFSSEFEWEAYTLIRSVAQGEALADTIPRLIIDRMLHACGLVRISTSNNLE
jgi:hypothetical protein